MLLFTLFISINFNLNRSKNHCANTHRTANVYENGQKTNIRNNRPIEENGHICARGWSCLWNRRHFYGPRVSDRVSEYMCFFWVNRHRITHCVWSTPPQCEVITRNRWIYEAIRTNSTSNQLLETLFCDFCQSECSARRRCNWINQIFNLDLLHDRPLYCLHIVCDDWFISLIVSNIRIFDGHHWNCLRLTVTQTHSMWHLCDLNAEKLPES